MGKERADLGKRWFLWFGNPGKVRILAGKDVSFDIRDISNAANAEEL